ncbi:MAG: hypothetical protein ACO1OT_09330 [Heyndrickxia sp.]
MKRLLISIVAIFLFIIMTACTNQSTKETNFKSKETQKVGFTKQDVQKAVSDGHIVIEQTTDDDTAFGNNEPNAIEVYNLKKIFAFEDNVDEKGGNSELKITTFRPKFPTITNTLSFDGKYVHFKDTWSNGNEYKCESISTVKTGGDVKLFNCIDKKGEKKGEVYVFSDNKTHFLNVKEEYKSELEKK